MKNINVNVIINNKSFLCPKCHGSKELDWVENIVGKKQRSDDEIIQMVKKDCRYNVIESFKEFYNILMNKIRNDLQYLSDTN